MFERINSQIYDGADIPPAVISFAHSMKEIFNRYKIVANSPGHHHGDESEGSGDGEDGGNSTPTNSPDVIHP
ncbi:hypothetical protein R80B4_02096 [Fibrobacteres bacterium R8-0-B4]